MGGAREQGSAKEHCSLFYLVKYEAVACSETLHEA